MRDSGPASTSNPINEYSPPGASPGRPGGGAESKAAQQPSAPKKLTSWIDRRITQLATWIRKQFDELAERVRPTVVVSVAGLLFGGAIWWLGYGAPDGCVPPPISIARLEVTYSASAFQALLNAEGKCRDTAIVQMGFRDAVFVLTYILFLTTVYLWLERWRRIRPRTRERFDAPKFEQWQASIVVAPLVAGAFDWVEDLCLVHATNLIAGAGGGGISAWVIAGSIAASIKWVLLLVWAVGSFAELYHGPRGLVLRVVRFSALAVALGAFPLLLVDQGQDILQRLAEDEHRWRAVATAVVGLALAAAAVWYCARRLVQMDFDRDREERQSVWFEFFAEHIPRILGVALLGLAGLAFARSGLIAKQFATVAFMSSLAVLLSNLRRRAQQRSQDQTTPRDTTPRERTPLPPIDEVVAKDREGIAGLSTPTVWQALVAEGVRRELIGLLVAAIGGVIVVALGPIRASDAESRALVALRVAAMILLELTWALYLIVRHRRAFLAARDTELGSDYGERYGKLQARAVDDRVPNEQRPARRWLPWIAAVASAILLVVFTVSAVGAGRAIGSLGVVVIFAMNAVYIGTLTVVVHRRYGVGLVRFGLALTILCSLWNDNHEVSRLPAQGADSARAVARLNGRRSLDSALVDIVQRGDSTRPIVLVAAAGGGIRAAYWTAMALAAIQDSAPRFARNVAALSGVSGGSLGVAVFASLAHDGGSKIEKLPCASDSPRGEMPLPGGYSKCVRRFMRDDHLSPVLAKMLAPDFAQRFVPFRVLAADRSRGIEGSWERSYSDATGDSTLDLGLVDFYNDLRADSIAPLMLLNSTHVETGRRYVASVARTDGDLEDSRDVISLLHSDIPLATAAHNSARFTYVSPAGHLDPHDGYEYGHVVDGGYFENSGLVTLREAYELIRRHDSTRQVIVIYLCNNPLACDTARPNSAPDSLARAQAAADSLARTHTALAGELLSPLRTLLNTRDARGTLAEAVMRGALDTTNFVQLNVCARLKDDTLRLDPTASKAKTRVVSPPLGWLLSQLVRNWMDQSLRIQADTSNDGSCPRHNREQVNKLVAMFR